MGEARILPGADVDERATLGEGTTIWHLAQVREHAALGRDCIVGRGAYVGPGVRIGDRVKLQNHALVYEPAVLEDGVFVGPAAVLTNDLYPRSTDPDGKLKRPDDWNALGVTVREGASIGARAVIVAGRTVGRWALVAAGAVVTRDVPDFALVAGSPARRIRWVGRAGEPLEPAEQAEADAPTENNPVSGPRNHGESGPETEERHWRCPRTGELYLERDGRLSPLPG